jgi:hypothetical protein
VIAIQQRVLNPRPPPPLLFQPLKKRKNEKKNKMVAVGGGPTRLEYIEFFLHL